MSRNSATLADFVAYCEAHPSERFWQALRNWSGFPFVTVAAVPPFNYPGDWTKASMELPLDTFHWEGKDK